VETPITRARSAYGVYVHVPFCAARCGYCDFATWTDRGGVVDAYVDACVSDVRRRVGRGTVPDATSVFFGGGTPSLLPAEQLVRILDAIPRTSDAEVTVECNPDAIDPAKLDAYRTAGVTRVSFGVQSMVTRVLAFLDRTHDPANVALAIGWARDAGFESFNLDLIFGTPGETVDDWRATLDGALSLSPPHVSAYALTIEPGTPLGQRVAAGRAPAPDDDDQAEKYAIADDVFAAAGLEWYEVSNWASPGHECRHNLLYWEQGDYLGVGCAAHGHDHGRRWWNVRTPERYIERIDAGRDAEAGCEELDEPTRREEAVLLALRTRAGATVPDAASGEVARLVAAGLARAEGRRVVLTRAGRLLGSEITRRLLAGGAAPGAGIRAHDRAPAGTR
jgi:putative oxygen-independent coproporphyrinogen III oxidase